MVIIDKISSKYEHVIFQCVCLYLNWNYAFVLVMSILIATSQCNITLYLQHIIFMLIVWINT